MSLMLNPFSKTSHVSASAHGEKHNVSNGERLTSAFVGAAILVAAFGKRGLVSKLPLFVTAGALLKRAATGHCNVYDYLKTDTRGTAKLLADSFRR